MDPMHQKREPNFHEILMVVCLDIDSQQIIVGNYAVICLRVVDWLLKFASLEASFKNLCFPCFQCLLPILDGIVTVRLEGTCCSGPSSTPGGERQNHKADELFLWKCSSAEQGEEGTGSFFTCQGVFMLACSYLEKPGYAAGSLQWWDPG